MVIGQLSSNRGNPTSTGMQSPEGARRVHVPGNPGATLPIQPTAIVRIYPHILHHHILSTIYPNPQDS